jgi:hypothetical protein
MSALPDLLPRRLIPTSLDRTRLVEAAEQLRSKRRPSAGAIASRFLQGNANRPDSLLPAEAARNTERYGFAPSPNAGDTLQFRSAGHVLYGTVQLLLARSPL